MTNEAYMRIALIARGNSGCCKRKVGAVLVLATGGVYLGWNGAPSTGKSCLDGGCYRCANSEKYGPGKGYDMCICVHAEERCIVAAGAFAQGGRIYSTMRPCFQCSRQLLEAGVTTVYYLDEWRPEGAGEREAYEQLQQQFSGGVHRLQIPGASELAA